MNSTGGKNSCIGAECCVRQDASYVIVVMYPLLAVLCLCGNVLIVGIIYRVGRYCIRDILVIGMAIFDLLSVWLFWPKFLTGFAYHLGIPEVRYPASFLTHVSFTWISNGFSSASDIIILCFCGEQLIAMRWIFFHRKIKDKRWVGIAIILAAAILGLSMGAMEFIAPDIFAYENANISMQCGRHVKVYSTKPPPWLLDASRSAVLAQLIFQVVVSLLLLYFNIWILLMLRRRTEQKLNGTAVYAHGKADIRLLGSSFLFIVTQLPLAFARSIWYLSMTDGRHTSALGKTVENLFYVGRIEHVLYLINWLNYCTDFLVYAGASTHYRRLISSTVFRWSGSSPIRSARTLSDSKM